ncbi:uncharacterized protein [Heptranchias perlo]|uniref:uncharacterized protein n=1 Tax=Heptranchias perlo TaxID=212740 RepID=UPI003559A05D
MEVTIPSHQGEEGDICLQPKSKGKIGLVRKLTKGGSPKLFLMKNKKTTNKAKASKAGQFGSGAVVRHQAGVASCDVLQENDETVTAADSEKKGHSENTKISPWVVAPGIDETAFEDNAGSGSGERRSIGEENEETRHQSSLNSNRPLVGPHGSTEKEDNGDGLVPVKRKIKSGKEPRQKSERRRKGSRVQSATWQALICVRKTRKSRVNEAMRRSLNDPQATLPETEGKTQKQSCVAAHVCRVQSEDTCNSAETRIRNADLEGSFILSDGSGQSDQDDKDADELKASEMGGGPEISRSDSQAKLRRKSTGLGWSSFRHLMTSKKEWRSLAEKNFDASGRQCQQVESAETEALQDCQDSEVSASSNSKAPLAKLFRGKKKKAESPSKDSETPADPTTLAGRDSEILRPEMMSPPLNGDQDTDLHPPGVSKSCQPETTYEKAEERAGIKGTPPAKVQDEIGFSEEKGQATSVKGKQESDQHSRDFGLELSTCSLQMTAQGVQHGIGAAEMNPSHLLETDGFPEETSTGVADLLQEKSTQATLGMVIETERQGLAMESSDEARPALIASGYLCNPSTTELQSFPQPKPDSTEGLHLPELLSIEDSQHTPIQESTKQGSSNLDKLSSKNSNPVCCFLKHNAEQVLGSQGSINGPTVGVIGRGGLSGEMNVELRGSAAPAPSSDSGRPSSCSEEAASCECQVHESADWNHLSEGRRCSAPCEWGVDPLSDRVPGDEFSGLRRRSETWEAMLVQTASCIVQSAMQAAVEQLVGETTMNGVPENHPATEVLDSQ